MKNRLRVLRAEHRWSQADLGEHVGVSRQAINAVENGKHLPSLPLAFKLAEAFDLSIDDVFDPHDDPNDGSGKA
jgi:putative transcriptional regulator